MPSIARAASRWSSIAVALLGFGLVWAGCRSTTPASSTPPEAAAQAPASRSFLEVRAAHRTRLTRHGPLTDDAPVFAAPPPGATRVTWRSGGRELASPSGPPLAQRDGDPHAGGGGHELWGWYGAPPDEDPAALRPALLYLHGGPWLAPRDFVRLAPLVEEGWAVLCATVRGKNGNAGDHELFYGEVDDAAAAAAFLRGQPGVDPERVYCFGHSMGGGTCALLSLFDDVGVRRTGSASGLYSTATFARWQQGRDRNLVRFDVEDRDEVELRVLLPWADQLRVPHHAYVGSEERILQDNARAIERAARAAGRELTVEVVPGGHMEALEPALEAFLERARADGRPPPR